MTRSAKITARLWAAIAFELVACGGLIGWLYA